MHTVWKVIHTDEGDHFILKRSKEATLPKRKIKEVIKVKCSVYVATSVDGFIARTDGGVDWLRKAEYAAEEDDLGYKSFIESVDALVMGRNSFEKILIFETWPYEKTPVIVLSSQTLEFPKALQDKIRLENLDPEVLVSKLAAEGAKHLYIDGGITIQRFLQARLIHKLTITQLPVLLGDGIPLFGFLMKELPLRHLGTKNFPNGFVQTRYQVINDV